MAVSKASTIILIEIWSDVVCPFCYIGKRHLELAMQDFAYADRVEIQWRSFQLNPNAPRDSNEGIMEHLAKKFGTSRKKVEEMTESMAQRAALVGLTFNHKDAIVTNTYDVHRLIHLAGKHGIQNEAKERFLRAYFTEGKHIGNVGELKALSIEIGLPESEVDGILYGDEFKDAVNQDIEEAKRIGINGVPFFLIDKKYTISGAQPVSVFSQILSKKMMLIDEVAIDVDSVRSTDLDDSSRSTSYSLLAVQLVPSSLRCSVNRLTATITLSTSAQSKQFSLTRFPLYDSGVRGTCVFDVVEYFGPTLLTIKLFHESAFHKKQIHSVNISLKEIVRMQSKYSEKADGLYWGCTSCAYLNHSNSLSTSPLEYIDIHMRFIEVKHCVLSDFIRSKNMLQKTELHLCASLGSAKVMQKVLVTLSRFGSLREALNIRHNHKHNALDCALLSGNLGCCHELLQRCGSLCFQNTHPNTSCAIHSAVQGGNTDCLLILLKFIRKYGTSSIIGWDGTYKDMVEWVNGDGNTPLHVACQLGNSSIVRALIRTGSRVELVNAKTGKTALMLGAENGHYDVVKLLYSVVEFSPLEAAMGRSGVKRLCDPSARDLQGKTAILLAAEKGLNKIVSLLLSLKVSYLDTDHSGDTLLHVLARVGNLDIARVVVGLEVVAFSNNAAARRRGKLSEYPQRKRYLVLKNAERYTPADLARQSKHLDLERFLLKAAGDLYGTEFAKSSGANTFDTDENQKEYDAADSLDYDFAIVVPKLLAQGFSPQGYYSMIPKVVDDGSDSDASE